MPFTGYHQQSVLKHEIHWQPLLWITFSSTQQVHARLVYIPTTMLIKLSQKSSCFQAFFFFNVKVNNKAILNITQGGGCQNIRNYMHNEIDSSGVYAMANLLKPKTHFRKPRMLTVPQNSEVCHVKVRVLSPAVVKKLWLG